MENAHSRPARSVVTDLQSGCEPRTRRFACDRHGIERMLDAATIDDVTVPEAAAVP
ncbi:MAG: hypothetical protein AAF899_16830 [Pseudomonadota bacterium]